LAGGKSRQSKKKPRDLTDVEKARLVGAIWIHGSIDLERHNNEDGSLSYLYPRIMLSMPNPLPYDFKKDTDGTVRRGNDGVFTLEIGTQELVEKRLKEILPLMGGEEKKQIEIALQIIEINRSKRYKKNKEIEMRELERLYEQWDECRGNLENWIKEFKNKYQNVKEANIPSKIWTKAYQLEDC